MALDNTSFTGSSSVALFGTSVVNLSLPCVDSGLACLVSYCFTLVANKRHRTQLSGGSPCVVS